MLANKAATKPQTKISLFTFLAKKKKEKYAVIFTNISIVKYAVSGEKK